MTALVQPRSRPLTLKRALEIYGASEFRRRKDEFILIRVARGRNGSKCLREILPDVWGHTFIFKDQVKALRFVLSLEDLVRERVSGGSGGEVGGAVTAVRHLTRFLIKQMAWQCRDGAKTIDDVRVQAEKIAGLIRSRKVSAIGKQVSEIWGT